MKKQKPGRPVSNDVKWTISIWCIICCFGCKSFNVSPPAISSNLFTPAKTAAILADIENINKDLETFKGIGKIRIEQKQGVIIQRLAWIGTRDSKLRIAVRGVSGMPVSTLACDGKWMYLQSYGESKIYKRRAASANLEKLVDIPIDLKDITYLLTGRIPIRDHDDVHSDMDLFSTHCILSLSKHWSGLVEKIYLRADTLRPFMIEVFNGEKNLMYVCVLEDIHNVDGFELPARIRLSNADASVTLEIHKQWTNVPVSAQAFELRNP